jgi:hypothetical protein
MRKYVVLIHGVNFVMRDDGGEPKLMGFYVNVYVETETPQQAEDDAVQLVRASSKLRSAVVNAQDDPPRLLVDEVAELSDWPNDCVRPLSGFIFYDDPNADWREGNVA